MRWYHYVAYFFGGVFLANALPHLANGISGNPFQSPFAHPPGEGLAYLLVCRVGTFDLKKTRHVAVLGAGIVLISLVCARSFARFHGGLL